MLNHKIMNRKYNLRLFLFHIITLLMPCLSTAQTNRLYTMQQGLQTSDINSLCIDSRGLAWIASKSSIGYFDGSQFHYIPNINPKTGRPLFNNVSQIKEDHNGNFWVLTNRGLMYFDSHNLQFEHIKLQSTEDDEIGYSVRQMHDIPGKENEKLVITEGYGVYYFDAATKSIHAENTRKIQAATQDGFVVTACIDSHGHVWMDRIRKELVCVDIKTMKQLPVRMTDEAKELISKEFITEIIEVRARKTIYFAGNGGILKYDEKQNVLSVLTDTKGMEFQALLYTKAGELLAGTDSEGIWQIGTDDKVTRYEITDQIFDLSFAKIRDMVQDAEGNILIALLQKGILIIPNRNDEFRYHPISFNQNGRNSSCITSIAIDSKKNYWIATDGAGIFTTDGMRMATAHPVNQGLRSKLAQSIVVDKHDEIWIGTYGGGVQHWEGDHFSTPQWLDTLSTMNVKSMCYDEMRDQVIVATNGNGIYCIDSKAQKCTKIWFNNLSDWTSTVYIDNDNVLWIGDVERVHFFDAQSNINGSIKRKDVNSIPICFYSLGNGANKRMLIGTSEGIYIYHPQSGKVERLLQNESIVSFNETEKDIWVATSTVIYALDKKTLHPERYSSFGGFYAGEFHSLSTLNNHAGNMLFGCDNGIICFDPAAIRKERKMGNQILFTSLRVNNKNVNYSDTTKYLNTDILFANQIELPAEENSFRITFSVPHFSSPQQVHYEYLLEGYDKDWTACTIFQSAYYTNVPSGNYTLRVRAYVEGDKSSAIEKTIEIHIASPWYDTTLAHIVYILIFLTICYLIWRYFHLRRRHRYELREARHNEEIKEAKLKMFTSIAHELRSPLTMIVSPLNQLITRFEDNTHDNDEPIDKENVLNNLNVMKHNCNRMLDTVRQITDIRKIDAGQFNLHFQEIDICAYIRNIATSFLGVATVKRINFTVDDSERVINAWVDPVHFEKIIINILSNAFKFCPEAGRIAVRNRVEGKVLRICISNNGSHIPEVDLAHIYERFYQTSDGHRQAGSGIGLNLASELAFLHHGSIKARNMDPDGVEFIVEIPLGNGHLTEKEMEPDPNANKKNNAIGSPSYDYSAGTDDETNRNSINVNVAEITTDTQTEEGMVDGEEPKRLPSLLIVDDNKDILEYLKSELRDDYNIVLAFSGNSAWNIVLQNRPDIILTDMKMPDGDGIELCRRVKTNPEFDHIPIIMLTGEGDEQIQIESLNLNVDHYIQKPFNIIIVRGLLRQVLRVRESMRKHIQRTDISTDYERIEMDSAEDRLFVRVNQALQQHLDDSEFGVQELADEVGISRVHLNRKMKEKYGLSPNVFIRSFRLKQAAYLLVHNKVNVSEVAYRVGFSTHSYFSSSFREYFGMSPKEFVTCHAEGTNDEALRKLLE